MPIYTARQLSRITLLMPPFASQLEEIYINVNINPLIILNRPLATLWQTFMVDHHSCPVPLSLLSREYWFSQLPQRQWGVFVLITFSCEPLLYWNYYLKPKGQSCHSESLKIMFGCQILAFSSGDFENHWSVTRCQLKTSYAMFVTAEDRERSFKYGQGP